MTQALSPDEVGIAVQHAFQAYLRAGADEAAKIASLVGILDFLASPQRLRCLCDDLARTRRYLDYAYFHNNGFFVLYVADPEIGLQVRLHVWTTSARPQREHPHRHRMGFVSKVLAGELRSIHFERLPPPCEREAGVELFHEARIEAPAHSNFAVQRTVLEPGPIVGLREVHRTRHHAGDTYVFPASEIHKVDTPHDLSKPVVTMTVWEPAFQPSIAYEPLTLSGPIIGRTMDVSRLTAAVYEELLALVMGCVAVSEPKRESKGQE